MENKIGDVESNVSSEEYKLAVRCRYKHGDRSIIIISILYIISGIIIGVSAPVLNSWKYIFFTVGSFILWAYVFSARRIKSGYEALQNNGANKNHYDFYEDYIFRSNETTTSKIYYNKINEVYEDSDYIICFTKMNAMMLFKKKECTEQMLGKLRGAITEEQKSKLKRHKRKGNILFVLLGLIPTIVAVLAVFYG